MADCSLQFFAKWEGTIWQGILYRPKSLEQPILYHGAVDNYWLLALLVPWPSGLAFVSYGRTHRLIHINKDLWTLVATILGKTSLEKSYG